jgi:hypothetical protein
MKMKEEHLTQRQTSGGSLPDESERRSNAVTCPLALRNSRRRRVGGDLCFVMLGFFYQCVADWTFRQKRGLMARLSRAFCDFTCQFFRLAIHRRRSSELEAMLARWASAFLARRRMLGNPLGCVVLRNKTFDDFGFAIGPQNIDSPAGAGVFASHEGWALLDHCLTMRRLVAATSQ